jgi:hypothetical protein
VTDILIDLITIYDDEESSGVSLITPVPITEEGEPGETSALTLKALTSIPQEGDDQAEACWTLSFSTNREFNIRWIVPRRSWALVNRKKKHNNQKSTPQ